MLILTLAHFLSRSDPDFIIRVSSCEESAMRPRFSPEKSAERTNRNKMIASWISIESK